MFDINNKGNKMLKKLIISFGILATTFSYASSMDDKVNKIMVDGIKKEANKGNLEEQYNLALLYETGYYGVKVDRAEAFKWYKKACDGGLKKACEDLKSF